jgi:hypothetical protein
LKEKQDKYFSSIIQQVKEHFENCRQKTMEILNKKEKEIIVQIE